MIVFSKYSNERAPQFRIRTDILVREEGARQAWSEAKVRKSPFTPEAADHVRGIYGKYRKLSADLEGTGLSVNRCELRDGAAEFPFLEGETLEERLDGLLKRRKTEELKEEIHRYFSMFSQGRVPFAETKEFRQVFGSVSFREPQKCRAVSDIDMIFSNALAAGDGYELIDYEWTFDFPIPVKYLQYRCLYYYILGNSKRDELTRGNIYREFGISREEQAQFEKMEQNFQAYMLGDYTPVWKLYDEISQGVIPVQPLVKKESADKRERGVEVYFDDGRGFGAWSMRRFTAGPDEEGRISLRILLPEGTKNLRVDPCGHRSIVRMERLRQGGAKLGCRSNGSRADNGDFIFDTEDPQFYITPLEGSGEPVEIMFRTQRMEGLCREVVLNQHGKLRWMEQTKVWKLYRALRHPKEK